MNLFEQFTGFIKEENLFLQNDHLLVTVSGGVDSVVLCALCRQSGLSFSIAHCNFQLRGQESERDQEFVLQLGKEYGVETWIKRFETETYAGENKLSIQVAARELRYAWFNDIIHGECSNTANDLQAPDSRLPAPRYILTAHHADDNLETMLMNFFKGTGIAGLRAVLPKQGNLVRPLLFARKTNLIKYAEEHKLKYVEDSSNASIKYTRNYFRNELIPAVRKILPGVEENLLSNISRFREVEQLYRQAVNGHKKNLMKYKEKEIHIAVLKLQKISPLQSVMYEITKDYGFTPHQVAEIVALLDSGSGKYVQSDEYRIIKNRNWLIISPRHTQLSQNILIENGNQDLTFALGKLECKLLSLNNGPLSASSDIAQLDAAEFIFPLLLRKRKQGDYFYPLGMQKKKKLSRFLTDLKLSITEKENTWVIEMNKKIVWVLGKRIDNRFKITPKTENMLQIRFTGNG